MITQEAIKEFKEIWSKKYAQVLTDEEALAKATTFLTLFKSIYLPIKLEENAN